MSREIKPLYRRVNSKARGCHHHDGPDAKNDRNTKGGLKKSLKQGVRRGLDYTPLFKFLLSKVGEDWDVVYSQAISRLDRAEPIYWMVARTGPEKQDKIRIGESSYYSGLFVDENNILQVVNPHLKNEHISPSCWCCTHTFNGKVLIKKYN